MSGLSKSSLLRGPVFYPPRRLIAAIRRWDFLRLTICAACRLATLLDVPLTQAAQNVVPVSRTACESVDHLRQWTAGRCLDADRGGVVRPASSKSSGRHRVRHGEPSKN